MKFTKNVVRGFTLIELLVVIAIIGLLSTIITGPIQNGLKKGRDAKKIGDMLALRNALAQYATDNSGVYPSSIDGLVPGGYLTAVAVGNAATTTISQNKIMYVAYKDTNNSNISYHLGVTLEAQNPVLSGDADCSVAGCGITGVTSESYSNWSVGNPGASASSTPVLSATSDFLGGDTTALCAYGSNVSNCIYDIVP